MEHINAILIDELLKKDTEVVIATLTKIDIVKLFRDKFDVKLARSPKIYSLFSSQRNITCEFVNLFGTGFQ